VAEQYRGRLTACTNATGETRFAAWAQHCFCLLDAETTAPEDPYPRAPDELIDWWALRGAARVHRVGAPAGDRAGAAHVSTYSVDDLNRAGDLLDAIAGERTVEAWLDDRLRDTDTETLVTAHYAHRPRRVDDAIRRAAEAGVTLSYIPAQLRELCAVHVMRGLGPRPDGRRIPPTQPPTKEIPHECAP